MSLPTFSSSDVYQAVQWLKCQSDPILSCGRRMAVTRQRFEMFRFPVMQSIFCFPNIAIITISAASLINYFRPKGAVEVVFKGKKRLNSASVSENKLRIKFNCSLGNRYVGAYETSSSIHK